MERLISDRLLVCSLGETYEKLGRKDACLSAYRKADATTSHNRPAAYALRFETVRSG
jgi:hypothetical protein